jgi:hypothetical protein
MKVGMSELREMVREALRRTLFTEAKRKPKEIPAQSEDAIESRKERQVKGTGYSHSPQNDFSEPLGDANLYKSQGASNIGGFTGVGPQGPFVTAEMYLKKIREMQLRKVIRAIVSEEVKARRGR